ncbi:MAG: GTPase HflX [Bacteroidota bacterium]
MPHQYVSSYTPPERVVLVGIITQNQPEEKLKEYLDELTFLADTAGMQVMHRFTQKLERPDNRFFIGSGKLAQIAAYVKEKEIQGIIFDDELSPSQQRNLEKELNITIHDRTTLILKIFASRARSATAKKQVELAQLQYLMPRLARMWSHLDRIKGGIGMKGAGEKEIETDRRIIRDKIALLKEQLRQIDRQKLTQRGNRGEMVRVSMAGYTNAGKSTLMNLLSKAGVFAENKLFATLDTTVRKVVIRELPFLLSDTVGFIRKLPTQLVESFKSTLDEICEADIILHVVDVSNESFEDHMNTVKQTLQEIGAGNKPAILGFNKVDAYTYHEDVHDLTRTQPSLEELQNTWLGKSNAPCVFISAEKKFHIEALKDILYQHVYAIHSKRYPHNTGRG